MARAQGSRSGRLRRKTGGVKVATRFKRLNPKLKALQIGKQKFADQNGQFDRAIWEKAFNNEDPATVLDVHGVTGVYVALMNNITEMMMTAARDRGLAVMSGGAKPPAPQLYDTLAGDGALTVIQADRLKDLNWVRNQLEHSSPTITADEVYEAMALFQQSYQPVLQNYVNWLKEHGLNHLLP
jgi:hypothetical protein